MFRGEDMPLREPPLRVREKYLPLLLLNLRGDASGVSMSSLPIQDSRIAAALLEVVIHDELSLSLSLPTLLPSCRTPS
jgi:hypothetical protein